MTCPECGLEIPEGDSECPICGFVVDPAAVGPIERRVVLPKPRVAVRPVRVAPAPKPAAPEPTRARRRSRIGAFLRAVGRRIASAPRAFDRGLVRLLRWEWKFLPDSFERHDRRVREAFASAGRAVGGAVAFVVWLPVRSAVLLGLLAAKATAFLAYVAILIVIGVLYMVGESK